MEILEKIKPNKKHLLVIHPKFCIRAQKQVEALLSQSTYKITIITNINKCGDELSHFIDCIINNKTPLVSGIDGINALKIATEIEKLIKGKGVN